MGYGTNMGVDGTRPAAGGHPAAPNPRAIDAAAANDGGLTWVDGKPGGECGQKGLGKNARGKCDGRVFGIGVDVGGIHGKLRFVGPSGRRLPVTSSVAPDSDLTDPPAVVESLWTGVRVSVPPLRYLDCTPSPTELLPGLRDAASPSETLILRTFCLNEPVSSPLDLRRRGAVPLSSPSLDADCRSTLTACVGLSPGSVWLQSSGVISMRCSFASSEPIPLLNLSLPCSNDTTLLACTF